ncbi:MAG TPA: response regulator transcription factor [Anaerolineales bacterium]|nr:response regulator transcription factor [Anaerolineales bacterium]
MIRIVVAEDQHIVRQGVCKLLEDLGDIQVVGEADNGLDAIRLTQTLHPDVLILDISMPGGDGLEALKHMGNFDPRPKVVILSIHADPALVEQALDYGALGYVLKQSVSDELLDAVNAANRGSLYLSSGVSHILTHHSYKKQHQNLLDRLSPREREVVSRIVEGRSTKEIAENLHTSVKTVEKQRRDAMHKLEVENVASLVRVCIELGLTIRNTSEF